MEVISHRTDAYVCSIYDDNPEDRFTLLAIKRAVRAQNLALKYEISFARQGQWSRPVSVTYFKVEVKKRSQGRRDVYVHRRDSDHYVPPQPAKIPVYLTPQQVKEAYFYAVDRQQ